MGEWLYRYVYLDLYVPVWPNLVASLIVYVFVLTKLRAMREIREELAELRKSHDRHHEELAKAHKGLAVVAAEVRDAKTAAESAHAAVKTLASVQGRPAQPWRKI